jgi:hypothetical protein
MKRTLALGIIVICAGAIVAAQDKTEFKTIDGVPRAINPAKPLKGTITLEVERTRTINPYDQSDIGLRSFRFSRNASGNVILYDFIGAEGHLFAPDGRYLGPLTRQGQGPGEFNRQMGYYPSFQDSGIWIFGGSKVAHFDVTGSFLKERTLKNRYSSMIDGGHFISLVVSFDPKKKRTQTPLLITFDMDGAENAIELLPAEGDNFGIIVNPNGVSPGIVEGWATPNYFFAADPARKRIYCGVNLEYKIRVKDFSGKDFLIIELPYKAVKIGRKDIEILMPGIGKSEMLKWVISAFPDRLAAIKAVRPLPKGHLGIFRITGPNKTELDIFDPEGRYLYAVKQPAELRIDDLQYFASGYATIEQDGDYSVYREYRIKNLPEIFGK